MNMIHPHTGEGSATASANTGRILVLGPKAAAIANVLMRMNGVSGVYHAGTAGEAIDLLSGMAFEHVLVDNSADGSLTLTIPRLAQLPNIGVLTVLAGPNSAEAISAIPGVGKVLVPPYDPVEIASTLGIEVEDRRKSPATELANGRRVTDSSADAESHGSESSVEAKENPDADPDSHEEDSRLLGFVRTVANAIPGLTPVFSILYKNLALAILAGLFLAFVSYGIMIAFFLLSGNWSSPMQLQPGHELVIKADREHKELLVKRNLVSQQLAEARNRKREAQEALARAETLAVMTSGTIDREIELRSNDRAEELKSEIAVLEEVLAGFGSEKERKAEIARVERSFRQRIITRSTYQAAILSNAQIRRQIAEMREDITGKQRELAELSSGVQYLEALRQKLAGGSAVSTGAGVAEFVPISNQVIEVLQIRSQASIALGDAEQAIPGLEESQDVLKRAIAELEKSPMIRAIEKPVNVLFVPYDNITAYAEGRPVYACSFAVFWCSRAGTTGKALGGEVSTIHPFFGKPLRGVFVEAELDDVSSVQKEILHVGRPPFFL